MNVTWEALVDALTGAPDLSNGRCKGRWDLWDETDLPEVVFYTTNQCQTCPALAECRAWMNSLPPSKSPCGVVAGKVIRKHTKAAA